MAEKGLLYTTGTTGDGASAYTESEVVAWRHREVGNGVLKGYGNNLIVSGTSSPVSVATGAASVGGRPYESTSVVNVAIPTPAANTRVDRIVVRDNWSARTCRITRIAGTEGAGPPALTQNWGSVWDIPLATVSITTGGVITVTNEPDETRYAVPHALITGANLPAGAVDENLLADGVVTTDKLANGAVTSAKIADGTIVNADIATAAAIAQSKISNAARAIDAHQVDGYHAGNSSGQVPVSNGTACTNLNADLLDGNHASAFAAASDMADVRESCSVEASSSWTIPTNWTDVPSMSRTINITQQCDLFIYAALNVAGGGPDWSQIHFRAFVDAVGMEIYTDEKAGANPLLTCPHWYFGGVGAGSHTIKVQMQSEKSGNSLARRRLSVIVIPVN